MAEQGPATSSGTGVSALQEVAPRSARTPRVVVKTDVLPGLSVLSTVALVGLLLAWIWSLLAPAERFWISGSGEPVPLLDESYHQFDAVALFVLLNLSAGLLVGAAVWLLRERRGPIIMLAAVIGAGIGAWLAMRTGVSLAQARYPMPAAPATGDVIDRAPTLGSAWVIVAQPLAVAFCYGVFAAWNSRDDLGRRLG